MNTLRVAEHDGGWLVSSDEAPIGYIASDGGVMTPSGAAYTIQQAPHGIAMAAADGQAIIRLAGASLTDVKTGIEWQVRDGWQAAFRDGTLNLDEVWALPYTLEDAQGTVPNRVKLMLAWILTRTATESEGT